MVLVVSDCFGKCCDCGAVIRPKDECAKDGDLYYCATCTKRFINNLNDARKAEGFEYYDKELDDAGWYPTEPIYQDEVPWFSEDELQDMYLIRRKKHLSDNTVEETEHECANPQKMLWFSNKKNTNLSEICVNGQADFDELARHKRREIIRDINQEIGQPGIISESIQMLKDIEDTNINLDCIIAAFENAIVAPDKTAIDMRGNLEILINHIIEGNKGKEGVRDKGKIYDNIKMLEDNNIIPEIVKNHMAIIRIIGNHVHKNDHNKLKYWDVYPVILHFVAICEWLNINGKIKLGSVE